MCLYIYIYIYICVCFQRNSPYEQHVVSSLVFRHVKLFVESGSFVYCRKQMLVVRITLYVAKVTSFASDVERPWEISRFQKALCGHWKFGQSICSQCPHNAFWNLEISHQIDVILLSVSVNTSHTANFQTVCRVIKCVTSFRFICVIHKCSFISDVILCICWHYIVVSEQFSQSTNNGP